MPSAFRYALFQKRFSDSWFLIPKIFNEQTNTCTYTRAARNENLKGTIILKLSVFNWGSCKVQTGGVLQSQTFWITFDDKQKSEIDRGNSAIRRNSAVRKNVWDCSCPISCLSVKPFDEYVRLKKIDRMDNWKGNYYCIFCELLRVRLCLAISSDISFALSKLLVVDGRCSSRINRCHGNVSHK